MILMMLQVKKIVRVWQFVKELLLVHQLAVKLRFFFPLSLEEFPSPVPVKDSKSPVSPVPVKDSKSPVSPVPVKDKQVSGASSTSER